MQKKRKKQAKNPFGVMKKEEEERKKKMKSRNQNSPKAFGELIITQKYVYDFALYIYRIGSWTDGTFDNAISNYFQCVWFDQFYNCTT